MATIHQPPVSTADRCPTCRKPWIYCFCGQPRPNGPRFRPLRLPNVTPEFAELLEQEAAARGLPPEPWPLP